MATMNQPDKAGMKLFVTGLSHKTAPVALREQLAVSPKRVPCTACRLKIAGGLDEAVLLSTCNRVELYATGPRRNAEAGSSLLRHLAPSRADLSDHLYYHEGDAAVRHLLSVASGLDSLVLGETEIIGQVKQAYQAAQQARLTGRILNRLFQVAFQTAKEVRTRTQIGRGATSVGSVAVDLAEKIFAGNLAGRTVMILGAGKMGEACVRHLAKSGACSVLVSNRSFDRASALASEIGGRAIRFDECFQAMEGADIVVSSTGCPTTVVRKSDLERVLAARRGRPLFLIDIAVPRDIDADAQQLDGVFLYNIDDLEALVRENLRHREAELERCRAVIEKHTASVMARIAPAPAPAPGREREGALRAGSAPAWGLAAAAMG